VGSAADSGTHSGPAEIPSDPNLPDLIGLNTKLSQVGARLGAVFSRTPDLGAARPVLVRLRRDGRDGDDHREDDQSCRQGTDSG
jgi:hypothetical protein